MQHRKKLVAGNWKMNGSLAANAALLDGLLAGLGTPACQVAACVPAPYLAQVSARVAGTALALGAQDVSAYAAGAYTGEVSASMLGEFGVAYCIVGHSERRQYHAEADSVVALKAQAALRQGITPIVCVGETLAEREAGETESVVGRQLAAVLALLGDTAAAMVLAYEPVWAIGTGKTASPEQAQAVHAALRAQMRAAGESIAAQPILYGGSMNAANAAQLLAQPDIDGGLIGGASLKAADFLAIVAAAR
ncbi:triose-phosphate isomerase [Xylophilus sp. Kf1]|nr:triose-phosphate isomerase [Xylophilus sp. Kf1]